MVVSVTGSDCLLVIVVSLFLTLGEDAGGFGVAFVSVTGFLVIDVFVVSFDVAYPKQPIKSNSKNLVLIPTNFKSYTISYNLPSSKKSTVARNVLYKIVWY